MLATVLEWLTDFLTGAIMESRKAARSKAVTSPPGQFGFLNWKQSVTAMKRNSLHLGLLNWELNFRQHTVKITKPNLSESKSNFLIFKLKKTRSAIIRSRARWFEHGEKNSKYFLNLEKLNYRRKHISSLINHNGTRINDPKEILNEERNFFKELYSSRNVDLNSEE